MIILTSIGDGGKLIQLHLHLCPVVIGIVVVVGAGICPGNCVDRN